MKESITAGIVSGLIVSVIGGLAVWYLSELREGVELGLRVKRLESDQSQISDRVDQLSEKINDVNTQYARLDERVNNMSPYDRSQLKAISKSKNIPNNKVNEAVDFLNTNPSAADAAKYLQMNLGFSPQEVKAVVSPVQKQDVIEQPQLR